MYNHHNVGFGIYFKYTIISSLITNIIYSSVNYKYLFCILNNNAIFYLKKCFFVRSHVRTIVYFAYECVIDKEKNVGVYNSAILIETFLILF